MIALDSNVLIYFLERNQDYFEAAKAVLAPVLVKTDKACVSVLVITEIMSGSQPDTDLSILEHPNIVVTPVTPDIAHRAGLLRQKYRLKTPDALHLTTAMANQANAFITNDRRLAKINIGLPVILLADY